MLRIIVSAACLFAVSPAQSKTVEIATDLVQANFASPHLKTALDQCVKQPPGGKRYDCVQAKLLALELREKLRELRDMSGVLTIVR